MIWPDCYDTESGLYQISIVLMFCKLLEAKIQIVMIAIHLNDSWMMLQSKKDDFILI